MKKITVILLLFGVSALAQTVTMTRSFQQCYPAGGVQVAPYVRGEWTYPGCGLVWAEVHGYANGEWGCQTDVTLERIHKDAQCTCVDTWTPKATITANKVGGSCTPTSATFATTHRCDFGR